MRMVTPIHLGKCKRRYRLSYITVAGTKVTAIYTAVLLSIELRRIHRIRRSSYDSVGVRPTSSTATRRITDLDTVAYAENR